MQLSSHYLVSTRFAGVTQQAEYDAWLRTFPPEVLRQLQPIADMARGETAEYAGEPRDMATLMQRPHIKAAVELGKTNPLVRAFNELVIRLNVARMRAVKGQDVEALRIAQEPLTDLGRALKAVLKELVPQ